MRALLHHVLVAAVPLGGAVVGDIERAARPPAARPRGAIARAEVGADPRLRAIAIGGVDLRLEAVVACAASRRDAPLVRAFLEIAASRQI
jgi:hypothetical protein